MAIIETAQAVILAVSVVQFIPLIWQVHLQLKSIMRKRSTDSDYQHFRSLFDESSKNTMVSDQAQHATSATFQPVAAASEPEVDRGQNAVAQM